VDAVNLYAMNIEAFIRSCSSFTEFFEKAKSLKSKEQGDVFERIVQLHLKSKPKYASELEEVWQLNEVPKDVREHLQLPNTDEGIDLITKHVDGTYWSIQAKYRSDPNHRLSWGGKGGLSTFTSLSFSTCKNIVFGLICSTTNRPLKKTHLTGNKVGFELFGDLLELDDNDGEGWKRLKTGLKGKPKPPNKFKPHPHQRRAIRNANKHYIKEGSTRGKMIMPCGTGKSLTGFWIAKAFGSQEIVVAVPSLALIKQTLNVWTREYMAHGIQPKWLAVCSDASAGDVDTDAFTAEVYDVGVPCVTDPKVIKKFLKEPSDKPRIIFTTYQSGQVLAEAAKSIKHRFDLGIMDEAHKTVGRKEKVFAHLIDEKNIGIERRVFMTATERFYRGSSDQIVSMHDPEIYGETFELLTFKQAIEGDNIICDYRFVTIGIAQSEIRQLWEDNTYLQVEGTELNEDTTRSLASGLALRKAYSKFGIKRAISFHKSIKLASRFKDQQEKLAEAFPKELAKVDCFHVSSKTSTGERAIQLRNFGAVERGLITNARCLTEGVDIPSVDCILFADPRQSKVDIVQAAGRALRKAEGKTFGYIIVPLVVPDDVDLEAFASSTDFAQVVTTIKALASEDERIVEHLRVVSTGKVSTTGGNIEVDLSEVLTKKVNAALFLENLKLRVWGKVAKLNWRPFDEAREFARGLKFKNQSEWFDFAKSEKLPPDIPITPYSIYANRGWSNMGDWLGTGYIANQLRDYRSFRKARDFARSQKLNNQTEWFAFTKSGKIPNDIPANPWVVYEDEGWDGLGDWLGTETVATQHREYRSFVEARDWVRSLKLGSHKEWWLWSTGKLSRKGLPSMPSDIPSSPTRVYEEDWKGWPDWLGSRRHVGGWRSFSEARKFVRSLGFKTNREWREYSKQLDTDGYPLKPSDIPASPGNVYSEWNGFPDWLGTKNYRGGWRDFASARKFVRSLKLPNGRQYSLWCKGKVLDLPVCPRDVPLHPERVYEKEFMGWDDWLGTD
jgi:superfamily II DNA or RNA helicase